MNKGPQSIQKYAIFVDMIALINIVLSKSSAYSEFSELFVKHISKVYGRVGIIADCHKTKSIKSSEQLFTGQSETIHITSLLSKVPINFLYEIIRNSDQKKTSYWTHIWILKKSKTLSRAFRKFENKCVLVTVTERDELLHLSSCQEEAENLFYMLMKY